MNRSEAIKTTLDKAVEKTLDDWRPHLDKFGTDLELRAKVLAHTAASYALVEWFKLWEEPEDD